MTTSSPASVTTSPSRATARRSPRAIAVGAGVVAVLLAAGACSSATAEENSGPTAATVYTGAQQPFGAPFEYANGLFLQVKSPVGFEPTSQAEPWDEGAGQPVRIRFTITNGTRGEFTPHTLSATAVSGGVEATPIVDPGSQIGVTGPSVALRTANVANFDLAFLVQDPNDVTLTVLPALGGYEPLVLTTD